MYLEPNARRIGYGGPTYLIVVIALMVYLTFAALRGEYGLFRLFQIETQETRLRVDLEQIAKQRDAMADKTRRLSVGSIDPDLLDEQARTVLGLGRIDEILLK